MAYSDRLDPDTIAHVRACIRREPVPTFRQIAAECGVGTTTVQRIADADGVRDRWSDRTHQTEQATAAHQAANAHRRAQLAARLLETSHDLLDRLHDDVVHLNVVKGGVAEGGSEHVEETVLAPGSRDFQAHMGAVSAASKAALDIDRFAAEAANAGRAKGLLHAFWESLMDDDDEDDEDGQPEPAAESP